MHRFNCSKGFTLVELLVVVATIMILIVVGTEVLGDGCCGCARGSKADATEAAKEYATDLKWEIVAISCAHSDTDNDGYISCTLRVKENPEGPAVEKYLDCASGAFGSKTGGCKARLPQYGTPPITNQ